MKRDANAPAEGRSRGTVTTTRESRRSAERLCGRTATKRDDRRDHSARSAADGLDLLGPAAQARASCRRASASSSHSRASSSSAPVRRRRDCASAINVVARWYSHPNAAVVSSAAWRYCVGDVVPAEQRSELAEIRRDRALAGGPVERDLGRERLDDREEQLRRVRVVELDGQHRVADHRRHPEHVARDLREAGGAALGEDLARRVHAVDRRADDRVGDPQRRRGRRVVRHLLDDGEQLGVAAPEAPDREERRPRTP